MTARLGLGLAGSSGFVASAEEQEGGHQGRPARGDPQGHRSAGAVSAGGHRIAGDRHQLHIATVATMAVTPMTTSMTMHASANHRHTTTFLR